VTAPAALLDIADLGVDGLREVLTLARRRPDELGAPLRGATGVPVGVALVFEKPSNRTRQSMEMAVVQLGGHPVYTRGEEVGLDTREPVEDVARVMSGYHGLLAARVFDHAVVCRLAAAASVPVINMLSDHSHPLQAIADAMTMLDVFGDLRGRTIAYVGDHNNVSRSLAEIGVLLGAHVRFGCPEGHDVDVDELARLDALGPGTVESSSDPQVAVRGAHAVHTDTWTSMGQEAEKATRAEIFARYTVTVELMSHADPSARFFHCLPAYRGLEVAADVIDGDRSMVIAQAHRRLDAARGAIAWSMGVRP
jgi:ornithine carbamoyltransferase